METKEEDAAVKIRTIFYLLLLGGVVVLTAGAMHFLTGKDVFGSERYLGFFLLSCLAMACIAGVMFVRSDEVGEYKSQILCERNMQAQQRAQREGELMITNAKSVAEYYAYGKALADQRDAHVIELAKLAGRIYSTRQPSNENMRQVRRDLVTAIIAQLEQGAAIESVTTVLGADALRDVVEAQIKEGKLNLKTGAEWQRGLIQHVLSNNAPQTASQSAA